MTTKLKITYSPDCKTMNLLCNKAINLQILQEIEIFIKPSNVTTMVLNLDIYLILFKLLSESYEIIISEG